MSGMNETMPHVDVAIPDIAGWAHGNTAIPYVWRFEGPASGPRVTVQGLTHGNEVCGAIVLDWLLRRKVRPVRGTLTLIFANAAAYESFDASDPYATRCLDEDFNRLWDASVLDSPRHTRELKRARELRPCYDATDYLLDLHSMTDWRNALLMECGQHWARETPHVAQQAALRFLRHFEMCDRGFLDAFIDPGEPPPQRTVEITDVVTIASASFSFVLPVHGMMTMARAGTLLARDGEHEIRTPYDDCVLIMPAQRPKIGETAVRLGRYLDTSSYQ